MQFQSWNKFALLLYELSNKKGVKGGNNSSSLISPAQFHEGGTRSNKNVNKWGSWACLDCDSYVLVDNPNDKSDTLDRLRKQLFEQFGAVSYTHLRAHET